MHIREERPALYESRLYFVSCNYTSGLQLPEMTNEVPITRPSDLRYHLLWFHSASLTLPIGLIVGIVVGFAVRYAKSSWRRVPPGPRGYPVLGNAFKLRDMTWLLGQDCKKQFSMCSSATGHDIDLIGRIS